MSITLTPADPQNPNDVFIDQNGNTYLYDAVSQTFVDENQTLYTYSDQGILSPVANTLDTSPYPDTSNATMIEWAKKNLPGADKIVATQAKPGESWMDTLVRSLPAMALSTQQLALANLNYQRAKNGQPPLDMSQYSGVSASVGLSPDTQKLLMYGVGAIVLAMVLKGKK